MPPRGYKKSTAMNSNLAVVEDDIEDRTGRFHALKSEVAARRRGPYVLTKAIQIPQPTRGQLKAAMNATSEDEQNRFLLGEHAAEVEALFNEEPGDVWNAFIMDLRNHFFGQGADDLPGGGDGS